MATVHAAGGARAFTLMEVMIAMAILFIALFAILELVTTNLRNARRLQQAQVDCGLPVADIFQNTQLEEGETNGDFGELYPNYQWRAEIERMGTNGLFHISCYIIRPDHGIERNLDLLMWKPNSKEPTGKP
jgi:prepilin-type N-terminal cleavage/methylation domain-containing protein